MEHRVIGVGEIHRPFNWEVVDVEELATLTPTAEDVRKIAFVADNGSAVPTSYVLLSVEPPVWEPLVSTVGGGGATDLNGLTDVILSSPSNTQVLQYNGTNWVNATVVGGVITYSTSSPVPTTIGGIEAGKTYTDANITTVIDDLLFPYQTPTFSAFASNMPTSLEVGDTIAAGSKNFTWSTTNASNINANSIVIKQGSTAISSGLANDGAESILVSNITYSTATTLGFIIEATNTKGAILTRSFNIQWRNAVYYGESALTTLAENDIEALRVKTLASTAAASYAMLAGGYKWICYPTALGLRTTFKDTSTNLNVAMNPVETVSVTNAFGVTQNYYAHRTLNVLGGSITIGVS